MMGLRIAAMVALACALSACDKPQTMASSTRKSDTPAWQASNNPWSLHDWKAGDKASWERQMAIRAQYQNDYSRDHQ